MLIFATQNELGPAIVCLICFSIFVQAAEGSSYGIVPYIDPSNKGAAIDSSFGFMNISGNAAQTNRFINISALLSCRGLTLSSAPPSLTGLNVALPSLRGDRRKPFSGLGKGV
jgi:hypothetical protein